MSNSECLGKFRLQIPTQDSYSRLVCVRLRERITWRFELWTTSWLPRSCGVGMGWRNTDLWFLHSSGTCKNCIFSSNGNNKMSWLPKPCSALTVLWMDSFFCLSRVGILQGTDIIWEEGKEHFVEVNDWHYNSSLLLWLCVSLEAQMGGRGEGESFVSMWITSEAKGWFLNALLKTESKINGNLWGFFSGDSYASKLHLLNSFLALSLIRLTLSVFLIRSCWHAWG